MTPELPDQPLFKVREVAALLKMSPRSVYAAIDSGDIPADQVVRLSGLRIKRAYLCGVLGDSRTPAAVAS